MIGEEVQISTHYKDRYASNSLRKTMTLVEHKRYGMFFLDYNSCTGNETGILRCVD